ncbi:MAG: hypothetical protein AAGF97_17215 [Planctomycetota bacterium]
MSGRAKFIAAVIYLVMIAANVWGMLRVRTWAKQAYGTVAAQEDWDAWRAEATRHSGEEGEVEGPVKRRVPKSARPPALVLMDDYFVICVIFSLVLSSILFATLCLMLVGATRAPPDPLG